MTQQRNIGVFCASSTKVAATYLELAEQVGALMARRGHTLIWGGGSVGMMGRVAVGAQRQGGKVVGIIPDFMAGTEVAYVGAQELIVTKDMRQRKAEIEKRSDVFLVLPGGIGTLDEMFEMLTLRVLEQHQKPLVILNHDGFYDHLMQFFEHLFETKFLRAHSRAHYQLAATADEAITWLENGIK